MKEKILFCLLASMFVLCSLASCGEDEDEKMSESLIGYWQGPFVKAGFNADSAIVYSATDSTTVVRFRYDSEDLIVRGKKGIGEQFEDGVSTPFQWEVKYSVLYLNFYNQPERNLEIWQYQSPINTTFEGRVEAITFKLEKL